MRLPALLIPLLAGCITTTSNEVHLADGSKGHNISCPGAVRNFSHCLEKAGEICGAQGYQVVNREGEAVPFSVATGSAYSNPQGGSAVQYGQSGAIVTRNLFVRCK